jgi:hypothetical protein
MEMVRGRRSTLRPVIEDKVFWRKPNSQVEQSFDVTLNLLLNVFTMDNG